MAKAGLVYVGTDAGLVVLSDPGATGRWRQVAQHLQDQAIEALVAIDALTISLRIAGSGWLSSDGGQQWEASGNLGPEPIGTQVATAKGPIAQTHPRLMGATAFARLEGKEPVLVGAGAGGNMLFRSLDDGIHWRPAALAAPIAPITTIVPASYHIDTAWAGTQQGELLRSDDRGETWHIVTSDLPPITCLAVVRLI